jgi:hypothetical protein
MELTVRGSEEEKIISIEYHKSSRQTHPNGVLFCLPKRMER